MHINKCLRLWDAKNSNCKDTKKIHFFPIFLPLCSTRFLFSAPKVFLTTLCCASLPRQIERE